MLTACRWRTGGRDAYVDANTSMLVVHMASCRIRSRRPDLSWTLATLGASPGAPMQHANAPPQSALGPSKVRIESRYSRTLDGAGAPAGTVEPERAG